MLITVFTIEIILQKFGSSLEKCNKIVSVISSSQIRNFEDPNFLKKKSKEDMYFLNHVFKIISIFIK